MLELQVRPIDKWPRASMTRNRKRAPFRADYGTTMDDLNRELRQLGARGVVLLMDLREQDIRLDGRPRAGATPGHPGVVLSFTSNGKSLQFPCDTFTHWIANLRAIALSLEALRKVDRYGVTSNAEQYTGWQALPPPNGDHWNKSQAEDWLRKYISGGPEGVRGGDIAQLVRMAEFKSHPDKGGDPADFNKVQRARQLLIGAQPCSTP